jgi:hypothetical protein
LFSSANAVLKDNTERESCDTRIDLVMWTFNSAKTLPSTLRSIEKTVPRERVNQKILIDGHREDETREVGKNFG